jgi:hypothetical protein
MSDGPQLPDDTQRTTVLGSTGAGKTQGGLWLLSYMMQPKPRIPWTLIDFKGEKLVRAINPPEIRPSDPVPKRPGLYVMRPRPDEMPQVNDYLHRSWECENNGIFVDEGYMMGKAPKYNGVRLLFTQGRSKNIPMIFLSQRPAWIDQFAISEADYLMIYRLNHAKDRDTVNRQTSFDVNQRLQRFNSFWYDVGNDRVSVFQPVPDARTIVSALRATVNPNKPRVI